MTIKPQKVHGKIRYRVTWRAEGRCFRRFFPTRQAAETFAASTKTDLRELGTAWGGFTHAERAELVQANLRAKERGYSISEALRFWETHGRATATGITLLDLTERCIQAKRLKGLRPESLRLLECTFRQFRLGRESQPAADIQPDTLSTWLGAQGWGQWRRRGALTDLRTLFSWGVRVGLLVRNPAAAIERPIIESTRPKIFTPDQCEALLKLTRAKYPKLLASICLELFAGIRPAEVGRLRWDDVDLGAGLVHISYSTAKTRARRLVTIQPALKAWLDVCTNRKGAIVTEHTKRYNALRADCPDWPRDVLRHSFISYELERSKSASATAIQAGNSEAIIFKHYRELVKPVDAEKFWALRP